ncbi:MAG: hypothetical protein EHM39_10900 [Chloroflexi bacterium]|nr:MAG: hypothetical protein EHM39_10900 [Chloroflexota bacterium]
MTLPPEATSTPVPPPTTTRVAAAPSDTLSPAPTRKLSTATLGPSPTAPVAPTLSPVPVTRTPTRVPTLSGVALQYFTTNSQSIRPGDSVTLFWSVRGADRVRIYRVDAQGERIWRWDVNAADSLTVSTRAEDRDVARFALVAEVGETEVEQPLLIPVLCSEVWFFDPSPESCPAGSPQISVHAEQTFEHGRMIWSEAQDRIYVLFDDGGRPAWVQYPDTFVEGDPESDDSLVPPPGLLQPIRGFGMIWRNNPRIQERLGWATTPEVAFEGMMQADAVELSVATLYLRARDGSILALDALDDDWEVLPPSS